MTNEMMNMNQLDAVAGGSQWVREEPAKAAGIYLLKDDGKLGGMGLLMEYG